MLKPVIAATALLAIAGSGFVYAQQGFGGHDGFGGRGSMPTVSAPSSVIVRALPISQLSPTRGSRR